MIVEEHEWIKKLTPTADNKGKHTGCDYKLVIDGNDFYYTLGCHGHYYNLCSVLDRFLFEKWEANKEQPVKMDISEELKVELLKINPCEVCGGTTHRNFKF